MRFLKRILLWLGVMAVLTMLAMGAWLAVNGNSQTTEGLKWLQFFQTVGTFLLPPIICAWFWSDNHRPFEWLKLSKGADGGSFVLAIGIMVCAIPAINLLADLNSRIELPDSLDFIEEKLRAMEASAAVLTERFLQTDTIGGLFINIGLMALLPALSEELTFRGTLQQTLADGQKHTTAIWVTAFIFSVIHMQFYGFIPRMLMGAMFGYMFVWTGGLWIPIVMHFVNNSLAVLFYFFLGQSDAGQSVPETKNIADTIGAGDTWWIGVLSLLITCLGLLRFYRRTRTRGFSCACGYPTDAVQGS